MTTPRRARSKVRVQVCQIIQRDLRGLGPSGNSRVQFCAEKLAGPWWLDALHRAQCRASSRQASPFVPRPEIVHTERMRFRLTKDFLFEAAQTLPCAPEGHKCKQMHGHSFKLE